MQKLLGSSLNGGRIGQVLARLPPVAQKAMFGMVRFAGAVRGRVGPALRAVQKAAGPALGGLGKGLSWAGSGLVSVAGGVAAFGAKAAAVAGGAAIGLGVLGADFALDAFSFKENVTAGFSTLLKSDDAAKRVMADAIQFASVTPFETQDVLESYRKLLVAGFKEDELRPVMTVVGDVGGAFGTEAMGSVIRGLQQIRSKGKLQGEEIMQLSEAGVGSGAIFDALASKLGKTREEVQKLVSAGKVDSQTGIAAILESITNTVSGGKAGSLMDKQSQTISGLFSTLKSKPFEFFIALDEQKILAPVKNFIATLSVVLDPKSAIGARLIAFLQTIGEALSSVFGSSNSSAFEMANGFGKVLDILEPIAKVLISFGGAYLKGIGDVLGPLFSQMSSADPAKVQRLVSAFGSLASFLGRNLGMSIALLAWLINGIVSVIDWIARLPSAIANAFAGIGEWFSGLKDRFLGFGKDLVRGLLEGVQSQLASVTPVLGPGAGLAGKAISAVADALEINSPSKVMKEHGADVTRGFLLGVQQPDLLGGILDTFSPSALALPSIGISAPAPTSGALTSGGGRPIEINITLSMGDGASRAQAEDLVDLAVSRFTSAIEELGLEFGVA
ncbi:tape measure protein [Pendulispora brunnea]|uniref:Tape measure protein n=1 Tax=Pendulispora brunnea TaxID=2905690 RepID=A0ABZ2K921_9BACT